MKLHLWCNVFIPGEIPGLTEVVSRGTYAGQTYLPSPLPLQGGFLTDNRSFSKQTHAPSRLHARMVVDLEKGRVRDWYQCGETIGIHRETGEELCRGRESVDRVRVENMHLDEEAPELTFTVTGACANPCIALAPSVDFILEVRINAREGHWLGLLEVSVDGRVEPFPAFEMYVRRSHSRRSYPLFQLPVSPEATLFSMLGPANRVAQGRVFVPASSAKVKVV